MVSPPPEAVKAADRGENRSSRGFVKSAAEAQRTRRDCSTEGLGDTGLEAVQATLYTLIVAYFL